MEAESDYTPIVPGGEIVATRKGDASPTVMAASFTIRMKRVTAGIALDQCLAG